jgi:hypothetical protein
MFAQDALQEQQEMRVIMGRECSSLDYANLWRNKLVREAIMIVYAFCSFLRLVVILKMWLFLRCSVCHVQDAWFVWVNDGNWYR